MRTFLLVCVVLFFGGGIHADTPRKDSSALSTQCFSGEAVKKYLTVNNEEVATVSANKDCWDTNPDSANRHKKSPGGVDFILCFPELSACREENEKNDVVYMTFLIPPEDFVSRLSSYYKEKNDFLGTKDGLEKYGKKQEEHRFYVSTTKDIFNLSCLEAKFGPCNMIGLVGEIQYFLQFDYKEGGRDWQALHKNVVAFIQRSVAFE